MKNYQKGISRKAMVKRIIYSWVVVLFIGLLIGYTTGHIVGTHITKNEQRKADKGTNTNTDTEIVVYGAYDDRVFDKEISLDWSNTEYEFTPLQCAMDVNQQEFLFYLCKGYNIDFTFAMALIQTESSFRTDVVSDSGDYGLMQINKMNHKWITETIGVTDFLDPYQNMRSGMFILRKLFEKYTDADMVLMAYNMGETGAGKLWEQNIYNTSYTEAVLNAMYQFEKQLGKDGTF